MNLQLFEKYRPRKLSEVIGQSRTVESLQLMLSRGMSSKAIYLLGESGTGKDTIANVLCAELSIDELSITRVAGADFNAEFVRKLENDFSMSGLFDTGAGWKACLVSEAHGMSKQAVQLLLPFLEKLPAKRLVLFTSNAGLQAYAEFSGALFSRCAVYSLDLDIDAAASHVAKIADTENLNGQPHAAYVALLKRCDGNIRAALQCVEKGEMLNAGNVSPAVPMNDELAKELEFGKRFFAGSKKHAAHLERLKALGYQSK